ncbi:MAG TPA: NAD-dependent epimerase/dehydratase family protein [bacterium]|nr:NAD-dependent epimerase/dehydratase family protein [bacterium]
MNILILGGTRFVGRHLAEAALVRGHRVSLFNRGTSDPHPAIDAESLRGDRDGNLAALRGRSWDAVIDTSGYVPRVVRASADLLAPRVGHYTFISTVSVYGPVTPGSLVDERAPLQTVDDDTREDYLDPEVYGGLKRLCERAVEARMPDRVLIPRLSLVVGPLDPTDRFTYWPTRVARGGAVLAFDRPDRPIVPFIDARDAARWIVAGLEAGRTGVFNVGGKTGVTIGEVLETCRIVGGAPDASWVWVNEAFLAQHGVGPWLELPLWVPRERDSLAGLDSSKAVGAGLERRPLAETVRDLLTWDRSRPASVTRRAGLAADREAALLEQWRLPRNDPR